MWKTVCKTLICVLLLGYVSVAFALARMENGQRVCSGIDLRIEGNSIPDSVLRQGVNSQLDKYGQRLKGEKIKNINLQKLEDYLSKFSNFETVECSFNPDSRLRITITPIKAEVRVFEDNGDSFYINRQGKRIKADAEFFIDVPVLISSKQNDKYLETALTVIRQTAGDPEMNALIAAYKIDGPHDVILIPRLHGHVVNFGDSTRVAEKRAALLTAYREILPVKGWNTYDTISVKFKNQIVASRRDKSMASHGIIEDDGEDLEEATLPDLTEFNTSTNTAENHTQNNE
ncbi:MAG: hypothetical protein NC095_09955 [Muribaculum sp.]|nr:hypothetical protein [Muribaculum sp.]